MPNKYWDEDEDAKGERLYETRDGRLRALNHIIKKYIEKTQGIKTNYKENVDMDSIIKMFENDKEFRNFTFTNYRVFIHTDSKEKERIHVRKITDEMYNLIEQNHQNLNTEEFQKELFSLEENLYDRGREKDSKQRMEKVVKKINYKEDDMLTAVQKIGETVETTGNEEEKKKIHEAGFLALREAEYYKFLKTILNKSLNLNLPKEWYIGVYYDVPTDEIGFTQPFKTKNEKGDKLGKELKKKGEELQKQLEKDNKVLFTLIKSLNLDLLGGDGDYYYIIPETNGRFVEVADNKGDIDPNFSFEFPGYKKHFIYEITSIRKYDDAVEIFIKDNTKICGFMYDNFSDYLNMKLESIEQKLKE